ncbi:hypothetical protein ACIRVK_45545, partial [Streptomyces sp. NPDC101152]|uniref:hypothetical protein n=1 Tax=Streptomyces sp. NPDC101152 TaxID=3366116 RepID=UPI0037FDFA0B
MARDLPQGVWAGLVEGVRPAPTNINTRTVVVLKGAERRAVYSEASKPGVIQASAWRPRDPHHEHQDIAPLCRKTWPAGLKQDVN